MLRIKINKLNREIEKYIYLKLKEKINYKFYE